MGRACRRHYVRRKSERESHAAFWPRLPRSWDPLRGWPVPYAPDCAAGLPQHGTEGCASCGFVAEISRCCCARGLVLRCAWQRNLTASQPPSFARRQLPHEDLPPEHQAQHRGDLREHAEEGLAADTRAQVKSPRTPAAVQLSQSSPTPPRVPPPRASSETLLERGTAAHTPPAAVSGTS